MPDPLGRTSLQVAHHWAWKNSTTYGVTQQHTLVQLTRDGDLVGKWSWSRTLNDVISRIS